MVAEWFLHLLVVSGLVAMAAWAVERLFTLLDRPVSPVWFGALAVSIALPLLHGVLGHVAAPPAPGESSALTALLATRLEVLAVPVREGAAVLRSLIHRVLPAGADSLLLGLWIISSAAALTWIAGWLLILHRRKRRWASTELGGVSVMVSNDTGPAVVGLLRPRIVVPRWVLSLETGQQRIVLLHELQHVRHSHGRMIVAGTLLTALAPWNPLLWWQLRRLRLAVELDCDQATLRRTWDPLTYGRLLITVASRAGRAGLAAFGLSRGQVERRLRMLTARSPHHPRTHASVASMLAAFCLTVALLLPPPMLPGEEGAATGGPWSSPSGDRWMEREATGVTAYGVVDLDTN